jgi:hypothetical protein
MLFRNVEPSQAAPVHKHANEPNHGFRVPAKIVPRTTESLPLEPMQETLRAEVNGDILIRSREAKLKFRFNYAGVSQFSMVEQRIRFVRCGWRKNMPSEGNNEKFASRVL